MTDLEQAAEDNPTVQEWKNFFDEHTDESRAMMKCFKDGAKWAQLNNLVITREEMENIILSLHNAKKL